MTGFKNLILAFTVLSASTAAFATSDDVARLGLGKTNDKVKKTLTFNRFSVVSAVGNESVWSAHLGQPHNAATYSAGYANVSVSHNGIKLREGDMGRYDLS
ncbi:hypothetical protein [Pseudomonas sp. NPDC086278]|uniref:hypothetical protein n=1 Tax=Pseudomonas sp. NPDC086278 TaxID=3390646 RepID=UPI003D03F1D0